MNNLSAAQLSTRRNKLYKIYSGKNAKLPETYRKIMRKYNFSEKNIIRQNHKKRGRGDCLYFSEKILRASKRNIDNPCAREYVAFIEDKKYFSKKKFYMIAFIPQRCKENICHYALNIEIKDLSGSHVFIDTMMKTPKKEIFQTKIGVTYRRD